MDWLCSKKGLHSGFNMVVDLQQQGIFFTAPHSEQSDTQIKPNEKTHMLKTDIWLLEGE